jgi:hypothetical protein
VIVIGYLPKKLERENGRWLPNGKDVKRLRAETQDKPHLASREGFEFLYARGRLQFARLLRHLPDAALLGVIAHECGHAVTHARDVWARKGGPVKFEWACEMSADAYAFQWGFEQQVLERGA